MDMFQDAAMRWRGRSADLEGIADTCRAARGVEWRSRAAEEFRSRLGEAATRVDLLAESARRVASAFGMHDAAIDEVLQNIEALVERVEDVTRASEDSVDDAKDALAERAKKFLEAGADRVDETAEAIRRGGEGALEYLERNPEVLVAAGGAR